MSQPLIILGRHATRDAAQTALKAGFTPWCLDTAACRDQRTMCTTLRCDESRYPNDLLRLLEQAPADAPVLLCGDLENYPDIIEAVAFDHPLFGCSAEAIRRVRHPLAIASLPKQRNIRFCETRTHQSLANKLVKMIFGVWGRRKYLLKPRGSYNGRGIVHWENAMGIGPEQYIQQYINNGIPHAAVYKSDGWSAGLLGVSEQLVGDREFGADEFQYCGSIGPAKLSERTRKSLSQLGVKLTQRFDLRGVFGIDLVMDFHGNLWPVEINPRYTPSVEIIERTEHISALSRGVNLKEKQKNRRAGMFQGKAVLYARDNMKTPDMYDLLPREQVADVLDIGTPLAMGDRICTIFSQGHSRDACYGNLKEQAKKIYAGLKSG